MGGALAPGPHAPPTSPPWLSFQVVTRRSRKPVLCACLGHSFKGTNPLGGWGGTVGAPRQALQGSRHEGRGGEVWRPHGARSPSVRCLGSSLVPATQYTLDQCLLSKLNKCLKQLTFVKMGRTCNRGRREKIIEINYMWCCATFKVFSQKMHHKRCTCPSFPSSSLASIHPSLHPPPIHPSIPHPLSIHP